MSHDDDRERFAKPRGMGAAFVRWKVRGYQIGEAQRQACEALAKGDRAGYDHFMALAEIWARAPLNFAEGPPVPIGDTPPTPPTSNE
jgi:hypothetical protein